MGRGRVELKRIENKINRQVTFAKRRNGLLKKAYELSVLCDVEVALIIFSNRGKLYEFSSTSNMVKTLERYQKCSYAAPEFNNAAIEIEQNSYNEYLKLKGRYETLQLHQRQLLGEDLGPLNIKELEYLEHQLDSSLKQIRSTKTQYMLDQLSDIQTKEKMWVESNMALEKKLDEIYREHQFHQAWTTGATTAEQGSNNNNNNNQYTQSQGFFQPLDCNPSLQIGYDQVTVNQMAAAAHGHGHGHGHEQNVNGLIPGWML
ncbi:agamous-like MADS-box protein MADS2 [Impatiens glandulifera]|uniref:agamous-like MADS-box protein MADS2 n=1 Tax=Impatiens glandulifera TaxID=253017 RepID=UPI001FB05E91|nr:agamous-like MADS-box protein MADS2 [Impatiens glandulifera]